MLKKLCLFIGISCLSQSFLYAIVVKNSFRVSNNIQRKIDFWKYVYTKVYSYEGLLHDRDNVDVIYKKIEFKGLSRRARQRLVRSEKKKIKRLLQRISRKNQHSLSWEERNLLSKIPFRLRNFNKMALDIRFQMGMRDSFYKGLVRSQKYIEQIKSIMRKNDVPVILAYLPHVESSFNYYARSKAGAVGIWQFMRSTGRNYLKINYHIDERRDPLWATEAAVKYLKRNYELLKAWPLAITAYNHGARSIMRAVEKTGTRDLTVIIEKYKNRKFGFASKNFFSSFLAAVEIASRPTQYFGKIRVELPVPTRTIRIKNNYTFKEIARGLGLTIKELKNYNPAIKPLVIRRGYRLPRHTRIRIPPAKIALVSKIKKDKSYIDPRLREKQYHIVRRGESLYSISRRYRVRLSDLIRDNSINNPSKIRPGKKLLVAKRKSSSRARYHTVRRGENLHKIARRYRVRASKIASANNISNPSRIKAGQRLVIPKKG